jgi:LmbE family N-acetylglucosaminyl deacetylase
MNPYRSFAESFGRLLADGKSLPLGAMPLPPHPESSVANPPVLIFSPHPDDECIIGGLALRLMRESGRRVINVAVTQGSDKQRQQPRWHELKNACDWIGFGLEATGPAGLERVNLRTRAEDAAHWAAGVRVIAGILEKHRPHAILVPHELDWNSTHVGTHWLVWDALKTLPADFHTFLIETEFWGQMPSPNLMVESSAQDVGDLLAALSFHVGEVKRNPYHLRLPAWLMDNVRRGAELVGGQGGAAPDFAFATLYRLSRWRNGVAEEFISSIRQVGIGDAPAEIFNPAPGLVR